MKKFLLSFLSVAILLALLSPSGITNAQSTPSGAPYYVVQEGDSLWDIAYRFHVSPAALEAANNITNPDQIALGQPLTIPGLDGLQGELTTLNVSYGDTLASLGLRYHLSVGVLERLNRLSSPSELYAGYSLVILKDNLNVPEGKRAVLETGQSLLELAILNDTDPWAILAANQQDNTSQALPGDVLRVPGEGNPGPGSLPPEITSLDITGLIQGSTAELQVAGAPGIALSGSLMDHTLSFFPKLTGGYVALQGIHAMADPGLYPLTITVTLPDGYLFNFSQNVLVSAGHFLYDVPLSVDPATLDPKVTVPEDQQWMGLSSGMSPEQLWQGEFTLPVEPAFAECYASRFGSRRSYNGSDYRYFHTGLDYCGQVGDPIYAAASGVVVFTGLLTVRGNATMIDHGHGVFTAYMHQSEILVKAGDRVVQGQLIGRVGNTGRVEGPHLHFEILVGGVQVDPLEWLNQEFP